MIRIELSEKRSSMWVIPVHIRMQLLCRLSERFFDVVCGGRPRHLLPRSSMQYAARNVSDHWAAHERILVIVEIITGNCDLHITALFSRIAFATLLQSNVSLSAVRTGAGTSKKTRRARRAASRAMDSRHLSNWVAKRKQLQRAG